MDVITQLTASGFVEFTSHYSRFELPSQTLLGVHATIAKILHTTGVVEQADQIIRDREQISVLSRDGSTDITKLLSNALSVLPLQRVDQNKQGVDDHSPEANWQTEGLWERGDMIAAIYATYVSIPDSSPFPSCST